MARRKSGESYVGRGAGSSPRASFRPIILAGLLALALLLCLSGIAWADAGPEISAISPSAGPLTGGTSVTITGSGFTGATSVLFGSTPATSFTVDTDTQISAVAPAGSAGSVNVVVSAPGGTSSDTPADDYSYVAAPTIDSISPSSGDVAGGTTVTINGSGFVGLSGPAAVKFDGVNASYTVVDDSTITAVSPAHSAGPARIEVTAAGGTTADTVADDFTYTSAPTLTRFEQTDSRLAYTGAWVSFSTSLVSGGSYKYSNASNASVTIKFTGTYFSWIGMKSSQCGIAKVSVDGGALVDVDLYSATMVASGSVWDTGVLANGTHVVTIQWSGDKNAASTGTYIAVDAFDIDGSLQQATTAAKIRYEQTEPYFAYTGGWTSFSTSTASGGSYKYSDAGNASVTVKFTGSRISWISMQGPLSGKAEVSVDLAAPITVDLYNSINLAKQVVWDSGALAWGTHTITIRWTGTKDDAATGTFIGVDAFDVVGILAQASPALTWSRYEQSDSRIAYVGAWTTYANSGASGGSWKYSNSNKASVTVFFTGTNLRWIGAKGSMYGIAKVTIDNGTAQYVDLYSATATLKQNLWETGRLASGSHKVKIEWTGTANAASSGTYIGIDAFDVLGVLPYTLNLTAADIRWVEQRLADLSYRPGAIDGVSDYKTRGAVIAFEKWEGLTRDGVIDATVWARLQTASRPVPSRSSSSSWIEVNKTKQLILYCKDGSVVFTIPVSTGSPNVGIETPSGNYRVQRKTLEVSPRYKPLYIRTSGYLAIHGYPNVPVYPASHGCIRTQKWDQDALYPLIGVGTPVFVF